MRKLLLVVGEEIYRQGDKKNGRKEKSGTWYTLFFLNGVPYTIVDLVYSKTSPIIEVKFSSANFFHLQDLNQRPYLREISVK